MKKTFILSLFACLLVCGLSAQNKGVSPTYSFNIAKKVQPPILEVLQAPHFMDENENNAIDANEKCMLSMKVKNSGYGDGLGLKAVITAVGTTGGLTYATANVPVIKVGSEATVQFPVTAGMNTQDGKVDFTLQISEPNGFSTDKYQVSVNTRAFVSPLVQVVDYTITGENGNELQKMKQFDLQLLLQNTQYGEAQKVKVELQLPNNVFMLDGKEWTEFPLLAAGEKKSLVYSLIVNNAYEGTEIPISIKLSEKYGKYAQNRTIRLNLNQPLAHNKIVVDAVAEQRKEIEIGSLRSDVDKNIPVNPTKNPNRFAIIIGNEDYHSYQPGLQSESDVSFAVNDAASFKAYCLSAMGVDEKNIAFLTNATAAVMKQQIAKMLSLAQLKGSEAEIIFYYAGHGFPDEKTKEPYIIPVDVAGSDLTSAIPLYGLYRDLGATQAQKVTVFLDACFSGGGRDAGLMAARAIRVTPKAGSLTGNVVVFAATQEDQTALPYQEKQHGMFTYFLLQKLQNSQAQCSYAELDSYIRDHVAEYSLRVNNKKQTPSLNFAAPVATSWSAWKF